MTQRNFFDNINDLFDIKRHDIHISPENLEKLLNTTDEIGNNTNNILKPMS